MKHWGAKRVVNGLGDEAWEAWWGDYAFCRVFGIHHTWREWTRPTRSATPIRYRSARRAQRKADRFQRRALETTWSAE